MNSNEVSKSLYSLTEELTNLLDEIAGNGGELSENHEAAHHTVMGLISSKTDSVCGWVKSQEVLLAAIDLRMKEFADLKKKVQGRIDRFDGYVNACLMKVGSMKLEGEFHVIKKRKPTKIVMIHDETQIPLDYIVTPPPPKAAPDKKAIADALKKNIEVPGCSLEDSSTISLSYGLK